MNLLVDLGNSQIKWRVDTPGGPTGAAFYSETWTEALFREWSTLERPDRIIYVSVQAEPIERALGEVIDGVWGMPPERVPALASCCGVLSGYTDPRRLGVDRFVAMIGARVITGAPVLVVDCGTAVTIDLLDGSGHHRGGWILPGIRLMGTSLRSGAVGLREPSVLAPPAASATAFGADTETGIFEGTRAAVAGAILRAHEVAAAQVGPAPDCLITGGDSNIVVPVLGERCRHVPDLIFTGLARYADETLAK